MSLHSASLILKIAVSLLESLALSNSKWCRHLLVETNCTALAKILSAQDGIYRKCHCSKMDRFLGVVRS